jgi:uncharacterized membrane protein YgdD (TMEM256/DUF423 family)
MSSKITGQANTSGSARAGTIQTPQNENSLVTSIALFVVMIALFLGSVYSLSWLTLDNYWPMAVCLGLFFLAFWIPMTVLGRSDSAGEN